MQNRKARAMLRMYLVRLWREEKSYSNANPKGCVGSCARVLKGLAGESVVAVVAESARRRKKRFRFENPKVFLGKART
ncbi:hypothetical protein E2542_SST11526 [Spatholobus suberectus]|nr:hypothetical protein E2542_SST11526 [Spatholobus suberectus]